MSSAELVAILSAVFLLALAHEVRSRAQAVLLARTSTVHDGTQPSRVMLTLAAAGLLLIGGVFRAAVLEAAPGLPTGVAVGLGVAVLLVIALPLEQAGRALVMTSDRPWLSLGGCLAVVALAFLWAYSL
ncbi:hypothetical protein [Longispora albida]|uniref:hypothetical protein n=1 Tax=Longispora albida TaxID=203523 RepID=UPI000366A36B|nr:hypothetical protein [Longispora albida]